MVKVVYVPEQREKNLLMNLFHRNELLYEESIRKKVMMAQ